MKQPMKIEKAAQRMSGTALRAEGPASAMTPMPASATPGGPYPGQPGKAPATSGAPAKLLTAPMALGKPTERAEQVGANVARLALSGGKISADPMRSMVPALPTPRPAHPDAAPATGDPLSSPSAGGFMSGVMVGRSGKPSSGA